MEQERTVAELAGQISMSSTIPAKQMFRSNQTFDNGSVEMFDLLLNHCCCLKKAVQRKKVFNQSVCVCVIMAVGVCCSVQCGRTGCSPWVTLTPRTRRSRRSLRWYTTFSASCCTTLSSTNGVAGVCGWTLSALPTRRLAHF